MLLPIGTDKLQDRNVSQQIYQSCWHHVFTCFYIVKSTGRAGSIHGRPLSPGFICDYLFLSLSLIVRVSLSVCERERRCVCVYAGICVWFLCVWVCLFLNIKVCVEDDDCRPTFIEWKNAIRSEFWKKSSVKLFVGKSRVRVSVREGVCKRLNLLFTVSNYTRFIVLSNLSFPTINSSLKIYKLIRYSSGATDQPVKLCLKMIAKKHIITTEERNSRRNAGKRTDKWK